MFTVRRDVLEQLLKDPEWRRQWDEAKSLGEFERIVAEFCRSKGYEVKVLETGKHGND
jgi:hypothetical protein